MDTKIEFITAQIFVNRLHGNEELVVYEDPYKKLMKLCAGTKGALKEWLKKDPSNIPDLPFKPDNPSGELNRLMSNVIMSAYDRTVRDNWEEEKVDRDKLIKSISKKYKGDIWDDIHKELLSAPDSFLEELDALPKSQLKDRLENWASKELEELFDLVASKKEDVGEGALFNEFVEKVYKTKKEKILDERNIYAIKIGIMFKNNNIRIKGYKGQEWPPPPTYIKRYFLPWLVAGKFHELYHKKNWIELRKKLKSEFEAYDEFIDSYNRFTIKMRKAKG